MSENRKVRNKTTNKRQLDMYNIIYKNAPICGIAARSPHEALIAFAEMKGLEIKEDISASVMLAGSGGFLVATKAM